MICDTPLSSVVSFIIIHYSPYFLLLEIQMLSDFLVLLSNISLDITSADSNLISDSPPTSRPPQSAILRAIEMKDRLC